MLREPSPKELPLAARTRSGTENDHLIGRFQALGDRPEESLPMRVALVVVERVRAMNVPFVPLRIFGL